MWLNLLYSFIIIRFCDKYIQRYFSKARWYGLHALINFVNVLSTQHALIKAIADPINIDTSDIVSYNFFSPYSIWPTILTITLHFYHFIFFKIRKEDLMHHLFFIPFLLCNLSYQAKNLTIFFGSGFPGLISYICLALKRYQLVSYNKEKKIGFIQNIVLRAPGLLFSSFSVFYSYLYNTHHSINIYFIGLICFLASVNGLYYLQQITGNYYLKV
jgi:hypothetical protein